MSKRIVFFGNERLATGVSTDTPVLRSLLAAGYEVCAVVTQHETGKSRKPRDSEISVAAGEHHIPVLLPRRMSDIAQQLADYQAEIGVLVAFGKIVPTSIINLFPGGIVNIHPSLLPLHRGPTPLESVILNGSSETGVSIMQLAPAMDTGPVYAQVHVNLAGNETKQALADRLLNLGADTLIGHLPAIMDGSLQPSEQVGEPSYDQKITKDDATINWQLPAAVIERQIRAYAQWPKSRSIIGGHEVTITAAHVIADTAGAQATPGLIWLEERQLGMHTSDGILVVDQLVPAGKKPMSGSDFILGYKPVA